MVVGRAQEVKKAAGTRWFSPRIVQVSWSMLWARSETTENFGALIDVTQNVIDGQILSHRAGGSIGMNDKIRLARGTPVLLSIKQVA